MPRDAEIVSPRAGLVRAALGGWAVLVYVFLFAPIVLLVAFAFNANKYGTFPFTGWTTKWFGQVFGDYQIKDAFVTTVTIAAEVTAISTIVGTSAAFPLVRSRLPFRTGIRIGMTLPIMIPGLLIGVSLLVLLTTVFKFQLSPQTAVIGQAVYTTPFVLLLVAARAAHSRSGIGTPSARSALDDPPYQTAVSDTAVDGASLRDGGPAAGMGARDRRLDGLDAAEAVRERRERVVQLARDRLVD